MIDYYPYLLRAVQDAGSTDEQARRAIYVRAWQIVTDELRARRPPVSTDELRSHRSAIQSAIERIEREYSRPAPGGTATSVRRAAPIAAARDRSVGSDQPPMTPARRAPAVAIARDRPIESDELPPPPRRSRRGVWTGVVVLVLVIAIGVGGYAAWTAFQTMAPKPPTTNAAKIEAALHEPPLRRRPTVVPSSADLAPGVDGGSTDADMSYIFRRQRVYYRTELPPGTIVVDKPQHFMYLVLPNSAALRYGIGVGTPCAELIGPRKISNKVEWPEWTPPPGSGRSESMRGGPGNPLGARLLDLDDNLSRIHGTNAPKTIGEDVTLGCVRLVNDDVADLYNRVPVGTRVVMR